MDQILASLGYSDKIKIFRDLKINPNSFAKIVNMQGGLNNLKSDTGLQLGDIGQINDAVQNYNQQQSTVQIKQQGYDNQVKNQSQYRQENGIAQKMGSQVNNNMNRQRIIPQNTFQNQPNINFELKFGRSSRLAKLLPNNNQQHQVSHSNQIQNQYAQSNKQKVDQYQRHENNIQRNLGDQRDTQVNFRNHSDIDKSNQENKQYLGNKIPQNQNENKIIFQNSQLKNQFNQDVARTNQNVSQFNHEYQQMNKNGQSPLLNENKEQNLNQKIDIINYNESNGLQENCNNILNQNSQEYIFKQLQQHSNEKIEKVKDYEYSDKSSNNDEGFAKNFSSNENKLQDNINNDFNQISAKLSANQIKLPNEQLLRNISENNSQNYDDEIFQNQNEIHQFNIEENQEIDIEENEGSEQQEYDDDQSEQSISELSEQLNKTSYPNNIQKNSLTQNFDMPSQQNIQNSQNSKQHQSRPTIGVKQPASLSQRQVQAGHQESLDNRNFQGQSYETMQRQQQKQHQNSNIYVDNQKFDDSNNDDSYKNSQIDETNSSNEEFVYQDKIEKIEDLEERNQNSDQESRESDENVSESNISSAESLQNQLTQKQQFLNKVNPQIEDDEDMKYCQSEQNESEVDMPSDTDFNQKTQRLKQQCLWGGNKPQNFDLQQNQRSTQNLQSQNFNQDNKFQKYEQDSQQDYQDEEGEGENSYGDEDQDYLVQNQNQKQDKNYQNNNIDNQVDLQSSSQQTQQEQSELNQSEYNQQDLQQVQDIQTKIPEQQVKAQNDGNQEAKQQTANISENTFLDAPQYEEEEPEQHHSDYQSDRNQDQQMNFEFKIPKDHIQKKVILDNYQNKQDQTQKFQQIRNEQSFQKQQLVQRQDFLSHLQHNNSFSTNNPELHHLMMQNEELLLQSTTINNLDNQQLKNLQIQNIQNQTIKSQSKFEKEKAGNYSYMNKNSYNMNLNEFQMKNLQCLDSNITENTFQQPVILDQFQDREITQKYSNFYKIDQGYKSKQSDEYNQAYPSEEKHNLIENAISPSKILNDESLFKRPDTLKGSAGQPINVLQSLDKNDSFIKINKLQQSGDHNEQRLLKKQDINTLSSLQNQNLQSSINLDQTLSKDTNLIHIGQLNLKQMHQNFEDQQIKSSRKLSIKFDKEISVQDDLLEKVFQEANIKNQQEIQNHKFLLEQKQQELNQQNLKNLEEVYKQKLQQETQEILQIQQEKNKNAIQAVMDEKMKLQFEVDSGFDALKNQYKIETEDLKVKIANKTDEVELLKLKINTLSNQLDNMNSNIKSKDQEIQLEKSQKEKLQAQLNEKHDLYNQAKEIINNLQQDNQDKDQQLKQERERNQINIDNIQNDHQIEIQEMVTKYEQAQSEISSLKIKLQYLQDQYDKLLQRKFVQQKQEESQKNNISQQEQITKKIEADQYAQSQKNSQELDLQLQLQQLLQKKRELEIINQKLFKESDEDVQLVKNQDFKIASIKNEINKTNEQFLSQVSLKNNDLKDLSQKSAILKEQVNQDQDILIIDNSAGKQKDEFLSQMREESSYLPEYVRPEEQCDKKKIIKKVRFHDDEQLVNLPHKPLKVHPKVGQKRLRQDIDQDQEKQYSQRYNKDEDILDLSVGQERSSQNIMREDSNEPSKTYLDQECDKEFKKAQKLLNDTNSQNPMISTKNKRQKTECTQNSQVSMADGNRRRQSKSDAQKEQGEIINNRLNKVYSEDVSDNDSLNGIRQRKQSKRSRKPISIQSSSRSPSPLPEHQNGSTNGGCNSTSAQSQSQNHHRNSKKLNNETNSYGQKMKEHMNSIDKNLLQSNPSLAKMLQKIMKN